MISNGTVVMYHGSIERYDGLTFRVVHSEKSRLIDGVQHSDDGYRYWLEPVVTGTVSRDWREDYLFNVRRQSFSCVNT